MNPNITIIEPRNMEPTTTVLFTGLALILKLGLCIYGAYVTCSKCYISFITIEFGYLSAMCIVCTLVF